MRQVNFNVNDAREITGGVKAGRIVTRSGDPVRILCWDAKSIYPIVGLIESDGKERPCSWTPEGKMDCHVGANRPNDLFIELEEPKIETREDAIDALMRDYEDGAELREVLKVAMAFADTHPKGGNK